MLQGIPLQQDTGAPVHGAVPVRHRYRVTFGMEGRVRFLSHLETIDVLLSALRRCGMRIALSQGMRPKPLLKVALPRPVAVSALRDVFDVELASPIDTGEIAARLADALPQGMSVVSVEQALAGERPAASRVVGAWYVTSFEGVDAGLVRAVVDAFIASPSLVVPRVTPKQRRDVDVRAAVRSIEALTLESGAPGVRYCLAYSSSGSAKPGEITQALAALAGCELRVVHTVRESIELAPGDAGQRTSAADDPGTAHGQHARGQQSTIQGDTRNGID